MSFDWAGSRSIRVNVVSWPPSDDLGEGRERARWDLRTLDEVPARELMARADSLAVQDSDAVMQVRFEASEPGILTMICDYDSSLPEPMRIGAASVTWRRIDERIARLWLIGAVPRARYPEFMRQRRDLLQPLPVTLQLNWLALSLVRLEPLVAALAGEASDFRRLAERISAGGGEREVLQAVGNTIARIDDPVGASPEWAGLASLLLGLRSLLDDVSRRGDVNSIAGCTERVFEAFHLVDGKVESGLAKLEDHSWWRDARRLGDQGNSALAAAAAEASSCAERVQATCVELDLRRRFPDAGEEDR